MNGVDDGGGTNSMTMSSPNAITIIQDAYVRKVIDSLKDLQNVLWEVSEEAPSSSDWWQGHMINLIHTYEKRKPLQHPVGLPWYNLRNNLGYAVSYANKMDLVKMTPQGGLSSTGYCLAQTPSVGAEYLVYASNGGDFTVNLSATARTLNVERLNPNTGAITTSGTIAGGSANQSFSPHFSGDAVLYLVDSAGHN